MGNADYYTVSFSAAVGDDQEGLCRDEPHSASVTVNGSTASIAVEEDVGSNDNSNLRAYTTYSVNVTAFNKEWGEFLENGKLLLTTPQRGLKLSLFIISLFSLFSLLFSQKLL